MCIKSMLVSEVEPVSVSAALSIRRAGIVGCLISRLRGRDLGFWLNDMEQMQEPDSSLRLYASVIFFRIGPECRGCYLTRHWSSGGSCPTVVRKGNLYQAEH